MANSYSITRVSNIGAVGQAIVGGHGGTRTLKNIGSTTLELMQNVGDAYGTGYPIEPGAGFSFDDTGRMTGPIIISSSAAGGAVSILSY